VTINQIINKRIMKTQIRLLGILAILALLAISCSNQGGKSANKKLSGTINIDGSSTVYPLSEAVAEEFRVDNPNVNIAIGSSGTGAGFKKFARGENEISDASRAIKESEIEACKQNNIAYKEIMVALDGISIMVNPENTWIENITVAELKKLWEPNSTIKKWSDIRPEWPKEDIHLYGPNTAHGTYDFFTEAINGESGASRSDYNAVADYNVGIQGISTDKYALGYFGLAYYEENKDKLKLVGVDNGNGAIKPTLETVKDGSYAPLSRPLFIYVNTASLKKSEVVEFVSFFIKNSAELAKEVGYIPLPQEEYNLQLADFSKLAAEAN
jgi:phosphate transport system substrate-binding protein